MLFYSLATKQYTVLFLPNSHVNLEPRVSCALHNSLPRAKDGKRQKGQGFDVLDPFPIPLSATSCTHRLPPCRVGWCFCTKVQRSPPETRTLCKGGKKVYLIRGPRKAQAFWGRGERNEVFIMNFKEIHSNTEFLSTL